MSDQRGARRSLARAGRRALPVLGAAAIAAALPACGLADSAAPGATAATMTRSDHARAAASLLPAGTLRGWRIQALTPPSWSAAFFRSCGLDGLDAGMTAVTGADYRTGTETVSDSILLARDVPSAHWVFGLVSDPKLRRCLAQSLVGGLPAREVGGDPTARTTTMTVPATGDERLGLDLQLPARDGLTYYEDVIFVRAGRGLGVVGVAGSAIDDQLLERLAAATAGRLAAAAGP
jgi:hypothetical protein